MVAQVEFDYEMARFISFRDREACERVRADHARRADAPPESGVPDHGRRRPSRVLPGVRRRPRRPHQARPRRGTHVRRDPPGRADAAVRARGPSDQRGAALARARPHLQHGRVRERGRRHRACVVAGLVPARDARAVLRARSTPSCGRPTSQIHFPTTDAIGDYCEQIEALGGADVCYGGIGWCGHIAFWEAHLGEEFDGDLDAYMRAGARLVELHPMTIMQNALHSFGGDWSWVPPKANTIGPREILGARHRSFWLDGDLGGGVSWQRFIARLVAHGPVSEFVPGSILQTAADRLHDPRRRRRRRRDPHGLSPERDSQLPRAALPVDARRGPVDEPAGGAELEHERRGGRRDEGDDRRPRPLPRCRWRRAIRRARRRPPPGTPRSRGRG